MFKVRDMDEDSYPSERVRYPWDKMQPQQWFDVPGKTSTQLSGPISARCKKCPEEKYTCRAVEGGVRVWRVY